MAISDINESVILEEVMSTHDPDDKKNFKINVIFNLVKSILYPTTIGDSIDEDEDEDSDKEDSNGSNGDKSNEKDSNDKFDEEDFISDKSDEEDSNGHKFDEEDSNDDKSDEGDSNGDESDDDKKSNEEGSDSKKRFDDEKEFDSEEEYAKDVELPYQLKHFSFEMSLMCSKNVDLHSIVVYFLKMLSTFSWDGKLLIMLAVFSLNFGEFSLIHCHNKGLSAKLSILKGRESQVLSMDAHFMKSILHLTEHIIELAQSSSHNSSPIIPIGCYWIVTSILTYASYFTSRLMSMHSECFIAEETQLSCLNVKIKDIISECCPILEEKREVDTYNALCHAFFDENPIIPSSTTSSNLDVLKLVFNAKKGGKQKLIYDGDRGQMVELHFLKNKSLLLLISSSLDIDKYLISLLGYIQGNTQLPVFWIPILDSSTLWDIKHMEEQYESLVNESEILLVRNVQESVAPGFLRFVKEKFFPEFQIGGEPIIVSLDHNGRMVHRNAMQMVLMRGLDICERMSGGVKIGDSIIPLLQKVLIERVSTVRDLVPGIDKKISEVAKKVDGIINNWFHDIEKQIQNPVNSNIFTSKKEKDLWKIETWCTKLVAADPSDDYKISKLKRTSAFF
ncbi:PREDICTED: protein SIEVE ELEMENT OCCLUSION B-like isoform X2 [Ipomoea nil]|uniref:protein SIEVE ELEMENT OCCLUSION B-like isoform X2 n=1 Tax=Ipomoea nil TaxID=35883 RepID=UPI0009008CD1|nr:PREDICTED: protein SIEVE ELEMENT OCCLUSION B-like isoform X2 [Ipomoea nil]